MDAEALTFTGQCHCGRISYEARGPILKSSHCECPACTAATGTLSAPFVTVGPDAYTVTRGTPAIYQAESGEMCDAHGAYHFCPDCGTQLAWHPRDGAQIDIFAGTLHDRALYQPA